MSVSDVRPVGAVARSLPSRQADNTQIGLRMSSRGEAYVQTLGKPRYQSCDEGSYFVATNPTPGTGIAGIAATGAFADAESLLLVHNANTDASAKRVYIDYLRLTVTAAGTDGTDHRYVSKLDSSVDRYTSGGSAITPVNPNMDDSSTAAATVKFGALVTTAASANARLVSNGLLRNVITVVGDVYTFDFGGDVPAAPSHAVAGTAIANLVVRHPPIVLGPGDSWVLSLHATAQTGATSYEFELGWWER